MEHLSCGGTVDTKKLVPACSKCGWSRKAVEKDNVRHKERQAKRARADIWWNQKRFATEREASLYRSEAGDNAYFKAQAAFIEASKGKCDKRAYENVRRLYKKAAEIAKNDDDLTSYALFDSMDSMIDSAVKIHLERDANPPKEIETNDGDDFDGRIGVAVQEEPDHESEVG